VEFKLEGVITRVNPSVKNPDLLYVDVQTLDGSEFGFALRGVPLEQVRSKLLQRAKMSGVIRGSVYRGGGIPRQSLTLLSLNFA
jgi:hypothetical protein